MDADPTRRRGRGHRRVTAAGTSGQPEEQEAEAYDPLRGSADSPPDDEGDQDRAAWLRAERPPHW